MGGAKEPLGTGTLEVWEDSEMEILEDKVSSREVTGK